MGDTTSTTSLFSLPCYLLWTQEMHVPFLREYLFSFSSSSSSCLCTRLTGLSLASCSSVSLHVYQTSCIAVWISFKVPANTFKVHICWRALINALYVLHWLNILKIMGHSFSWQILVSYVCWCHMILAFSASAFIICPWCFCCASCTTYVRKALCCNIALPSACVPVLIANLLNNPSYPSHAHTSIQWQVPVQSWFALDSVNSKICHCVLFICCRYCMISW